MWEISSALQLQTSVCSFFLGSLLCVFYDVIKAFRLSSGSKTTAVFAADIIFSFVAAIITFLFLLSTTNGEIRGYVLFLEALGFLIFRFTLSKFLLKILIKLSGLFLRAVNYVSEFLFKSSLKIEKYSKAFFVFLKKTFKNIHKLSKKS